MKKIPVLCTGLMLVASSAFAQGQGLHLKWNGCPNHSAATSTEDFTCDGSAHNLYGTFSVAVTTSGVIAMEGIIDLLFESPDVPAFWQFDAGACNQAGLVLSDARPTTNCTSFANTQSMCGMNGSSCDEFLTQYLHGASSGFPANRARLMFALMGSSTYRTTLAANTGTNAHFAFQLTFSEDHATEMGGACDGCGTGVSFTWNQAIFYNTVARSGGEGIAALLSSTDPGSVDATVFSNCGACSAVSTKARRWGQLKSLYR